MCIITGLITGITAAATAIASAASAAVGVMANVGFGIIGAIGGSSAIAAAPTALGVGLGAATIAGGVAAVGMAAYGTLQGISSARANAKAMEAQARAMQDLTTETGTLEVNKTANSLQDNSRVKRTLSSLRVPMGIIPQQNTETITQNVYGVDTNPITTATQNMTGLNIAAA